MIQPARIALLGSLLTLSFASPALAAETLSLSGAFSLYAASLAHGLPEAAARTSAFVALVIGNLTLALTVASAPGSPLLDSRRVAFWIIAPVAVAALGLCVAVPPLAQLLKLAPPTALQLALAAGTGLVGGGASWLAMQLRGPASRRAG